MTVSEGVRLSNWTAATTGWESDAARNHGTPIFWVTVRYHVTGRVVTYRATTAFKRALMIITTRLDADVIAQGESLT